MFRTPARRGIFLYIKQGTQRYETEGALGRVAHHLGVDQHTIFQAEVNPLRLFWIPKLVNTQFGPNIFFILLFVGWGQNLRHNNVVSRSSQTYTICLEKL